MMLPIVSKRSKLEQVERETSFLPGRQIVRFAVLALVLLAAGVVLWMFGPSAYRTAKLGRLEGDAERLLKAGETGQAVLAAQTALLLDSENIRALDVLAEAATREGSPMALVFRQQIMKADPGPQRSIDYARALLAAGRADEAKRALEGVSGDARNELEFQNILSAALLAGGDISGAKQAAERAVALSGEDHAALANLVVVLLYEPSDSSAKRINDILGKLWQDAAFRSRMNRVLAGVARNNGDLGTARKLAADLAAADDALPSDKVVYLDVLAVQSPSEAAGQARAYLDASTAEDPAVAVPVAAWMLRQGNLAKDVSDWVESLPEADADNDAIRLTRADAMAQQDRWQEMVEQMDKAEWGTVDYVRLAYLSRALSEQGNEILAGARWRQAVRAASASPQFLWSLWAVTSQWNGWQERGIDLMWELYEATRSPAMLSQLSQAYAERHSAADLLRVARIAHAANPDSFAASNNFAYLALLLGQDQQEAIVTAEKNYRADVNDPPRVSTYALALTRDGRAPEALALLDTLPAEVRNSSRLALVDALVQSAAGNRNGSLAALTRLGTEPLLDAEQRILEEIRKGAE